MEREVAQVHPRADQAGALARHNAQQEAPAMLAALRDAMEELQAWRSKFHPNEWPDKPVVHTATRDKIAATLSRIDGAPTAQPAAPIGEAGRPTYAELAHAARDAAAWFANGGELDGCMIDESEMAGRFAGLVAAMGGEG